MAVLIEVYHKERCVGRCDARCYEARRSNCGCICGGMNHGAGLDQAVRNTIEMAERVGDDGDVGEKLARFKAVRGWDPELALRVAVPAVQLALL